MSVFVSYDIKGIQKTIFSVPKLKTIIGGSAQIALFDDSINNLIDKLGGVHKVFSGGGRGISSFHRSRLRHNSCW